MELSRNNNKSFIVTPDIFEILYCGDHIVYYDPSFAWDIIVGRGSPVNR
jgi:hypothetical protein